VAIKEVGETGDLDVKALVSRIGIEMKVHRARCIGNEGRLFNLFSSLIHTVIPANSNNGLYKLEKQYKEI